MATQTGPLTRSPPNLSFPPKYHPTSPDPRPTTPRSLPAFNFPLYPPKPKPQHQPLPEIATPLGLTPNPNSKPDLDSDFNSNPVQKSTFLTIPLEIRLQIYNYVLLSHPVHHPHLAPVSELESESKIRTWLRPAAITFPTACGRDCAVIRTVFARPTRGGENDYDFSATTSSMFSSCSYSSSSHPAVHRRIQEIGKGNTQILSKIPTSLLLANSQIFYETHLLPWQTNTFLFVNWFWSGIYASRQFMRGLKPWQAESLRGVGVEVLGRDLWCEVGGKEGNGGDGKGVQGWIDVCKLWSGVRRLSLCVKGSLIVDSSGGSNDKSNSNLHSNLDSNLYSNSNEKSQEKGQGKGKEAEIGEEGRFILDVSREWVTNGLCKLPNLRNLELEIPDDSLSTESKLRFCAELESCLNLNARQRSTSTGEERERERERERQGERRDSWEGSIQVTFISRLPSKKMGLPGPEEDIRYFGGEGGDWNLNTNEGREEGGGLLDM